MATPAKVDKKPVCKFGAKCYRKNEQHLKQYRHPHDDEEDEQPTKGKGDVTTPKPKAGTIEQYFGKRKVRSKSDSEGEEDEDAGTSEGKRLKPVKNEGEEATVEKEDEKTDQKEDEKTDQKEDEKTDQKEDEDADKKEDEDADKKEDESADEKDDESLSDAEDGASEEDVDDAEMPESPVDVRENIKSKFLVEMPDDFYDFWKLCQKLNAEDPLEALEDTLGFTLVGPFDVLAGQHKDVERNSAGRRPNFLLHWRYYYDPPEFLTVIKGDGENQFHLGYFRDVPSEMPVFVAANCARDNGNITPRGDNLFAAVSFYISEQLKDEGLACDNIKSLQKLQELVKSAASEGGHSLDLKTKGMRARDKKVVCKTFHGAGLVVPVDENGVGYRPVPETPGDLKKILTKIRDSKTEAERDKNLDPLQEIITLVQFANDECDHGEGLELGLDLFTFGGKCFHSAIDCLLTLGYVLVGHREFSKVIAAHLKRRSHSADLSQLD